MRRERVDRTASATMRRAIEFGRPKKEKCEFTNHE